MLQSGGVYPMLDPRRSLELFASYHAHPDSPSRLLSLLQLEEVSRTPWRHLSGGEQRRLALGLALIGRPELLFLDEPTAGVDPEGRLAVRDVVSSLSDEGTTIVMTTHELDEAQRLADRVVVLRRGRIVAQGSLADLSASSGPDGIRFRVAGDIDVAALAAELGAPVERRGPGDYLVTAAASPAVTTSLTSWLGGRQIALLELRTERSLEETYLELMRADAAGSEGGPEDVTANNRRERRRRTRAPRRSR